MNKQPMRVFALCCMLTVSLCFVVGGLVLTTSDKDTTKRDFIEYWEAGQQFVHGANPYDVTAALQLERAVGLEGGHGDRRRPDDRGARGLAGSWPPRPGRPGLAVATNWPARRNTFRSPASHSSCSVPVLREL